MVEGRGGFSFQNRGGKKENMIGEKKGVGKTRYKVKTNHLINRDYPLLSRRETLSHGVSFQGKVVSCQKLTGGIGPRVIKQRQKHNDGVGAKRRERREESRRVRLFGGNSVWTAGFQGGC